VLRSPPSILRSLHTFLKLICGFTSSVMVASYTLGWGMCLFILSRARDTYIPSSLNRRREFEPFLFQQHSQTIPLSSKFPSRTARNKTTELLLGICPSITPSKALLVLPLHHHHHLTSVLSYYVSFHEPITSASAISRSSDFDA
jgi:hypothetical protein